MKIKLALIYPFILLFVMKGFAQKDPIDTFIEQQMKQQKITGLSLGIIRNGKIYKTKGYGYANLEYNVPVTNNTVFKLASVSKQMVATGIMILVQEGKLKLTDPITKYFKEAPEFWNSITIRHLLNHSSGLPRESPAFDATKVQPDSILIRAAYKEKLVFPTGTSWQYCNLGYFMLADIIRQLSGLPFQEFLKERIFDKYGLHATQTTTLSTIVPYRADGYIHLGGDTILNAINYIALRPSGAFISTITDLLKWETMIEKQELLSKESWEQMWQDTVKTTYRSTDFTTIYYGYGWNVTTYRNRKLLYHGGSLPGFRTMYYRFPEDKTAIIVLTNTEPVDAGRIALGVAKILHNEN